MILVVEAVGIVLLNIFLSMVVDAQQMSMAHLEPRSMSLSAVVAGGLFGGYLLLCAVVLARTAIRDKAPVGLLRIILISAAVVHGMLGAASVGLVGWVAFLFMMLVLGLIVWSLLSYSPEEPSAEGTSQQGTDAPPPSGGSQPEPSAP
ncbi:hypothetical protein DB35_15245 [Streptomyces abyssalis]|uniref:Uncharacterized protein n=1 Tax=Streptomyces abyssalis TaxID=933944 RepID=A0A1E7JIH8_9ACTN|nr:hypothetical protein AN215_22760 [Streptomyces abyssalis]OEU93392.1 hypothetical protein DB35_15245 [Streptomyces abyssalis]